MLKHNTLVASRGAKTSGYLGNAGTVFAEIALLRRVELGLAYIAIIATESLLVLGYALYVGEGLSSREWLGAGFVIIGATLVSY